MRGITNVTGSGGHRGPSSMWELPAASQERGCVNSCLGCGAAPHIYMGKGRKRSFLRDRAVKLCCLILGPGIELTNCSAQKFLSG